MRMMSITILGLGFAGLAVADGRDIVVNDIRNALAVNKLSNSTSVILNGTAKVNDATDEFRIEFLLDAGSDRREPRLMIREFIGPEGGPLKQVAATWVQDEILYAYSFIGNAYTATPFGPKTRTSSQTAVDSLLQKLNASTRNQVVHVVKYLRDVYVRPTTEWQPWQPTAMYKDGIFRLDAGSRTEQFAYGISDPNPDFRGDEWLSNLSYFKQENLMGQVRTTNWNASIYPGSLPNDPGTFSFRMPANARLIQPGR